MEDSSSIEAESRRSELASRFIESLVFPPYRVQEDALLAWFTVRQGVLVCAPTGTGKTVIAQAALFEALHTGSVAYYTTPLIALTEQKFREMQEAAERWGFSRDDVGLVTGNRKVNPQARVLVVVAEILLNRLLHPAAFDFSGVSSVVVDEFHSFSDPERGIVWELTLGLLPAHVRLLLLSATVGNSGEFLEWLKRSHGRSLELVQETERKVPLSHHWVGDQFLPELLESMAIGGPDDRTTPALVFCFNRDECWTVAEQFKGLDLLSPAERALIKIELEPLTWNEGVAPKLKQMLLRGVGVHHAGLLPKYRRLVEDLYLRKLLSVCVCTETLAAGINLPARSVVLTTLLKGPRGKKKLIDASSFQQICGRAGRPQFDTKGYVYALAHEDDVRIARWREKYDSIPDHVKDPGLIKAKKELWRKRPTRRDTEQYWGDPQFQKLIGSPPGRLTSKGPLPWRLLAYLLKTSPDIERIRAFVRKRLYDSGHVEGGLKQLDRMLLTLHRGGFVRLEPPPPSEDGPNPEPIAAPKPVPPTTGLFSRPVDSRSSMPSRAPTTPESPPATPRYQALTATATPSLDTLLVFRGTHPLYAAFLVEHLGVANAAERLQALESVLTMPRPLWRSVRVPSHDELPPGPLENERLDRELLKRGLIKPVLPTQPDDEDEGDDPFEEEERPPVLAEKLKMLFDAIHPHVTDVEVHEIWAAGELLRFGGDFNRYVRARDLTKQEGIIFRHLLRLILLCAEFSAVTPEGVEQSVWRAELKNLAMSLTASCRQVDPAGLDEAMSHVLAADAIEGDARADTAPVSEGEPDAWERHWDDLVAELLPP